MRWVPGDLGYGSLCSSSANPVPRVSEYFPPIQYFPSIQLLECVSISQWEIPTNPVFQCQSICLALSVNRALPTLHKGPAIPSWSPNSTDLYFRYLFVELAVATPVEWQNFVSVVPAAKKNQLGPIFFLNIRVIYLNI